MSSPLEVPGSMTLTQILNAKVGLEKSILLLVQQVEEYGVIVDSIQLKRVDMHSIGSRPPHGKVFDVSVDLKL